MRLLTHLQSPHTQIASQFGQSRWSNVDVPANFLNRHRVNWNVISTNPDVTTVVIAEIRDSQVVVY